MIEKKTYPWRTILLIVSITELFIGGGGRFMTVGPLSMRMWLFALTQAVVWWDILKGNYQPAKRFYTYVGLFLGVTVLGAIHGYLNEAPLKLILTDVKPLLFWLNLLFYGMVIQSPQQVFLVRACLKWSSAFLAVAYITLLLLWKYQIVHGFSFYMLTLPTEELSFRGSLGFFYKGFIFLPVGIFFWLQEKTYRKYFWVFLIYLAILLTFTRGFWLLIFGIHLVYTIFFNSRSAVSWLAIVLMLTSLYSVGLYVSQVDHQNFPELMHFQQESIKRYEAKDLKPWQRALASKFSQGFEARESSIIDRIIQVGEVEDHLTLKSFLIGNGLGKGIPSRQIHMEISYLEIFHKQGLLGLLLWLWLLWSLLKRFREAIGNRLHQITLFHENAFVFLMAALFMFGISLLNPFINSPMGLGMLALSLVCLEVLPPTTKSHEAH
ncbi:MAG: hypothetical protein Q8J69_01845 [Sphingobacteriaceae bacterium]|nr:hypothetical protein [Sphingobacteriaceae bacterium]